jgi:S-adenosylmethionine hydrolase
MSKNQNTFIKKQKAELKKRRKRDKQEKMASRKDQPKRGDLEDMLAYVDEFGNISDTPPEPEPQKKEISPSQKFNRNNKFKSQ